MSDQLEVLETWVGGLMAALSPTERRKLAKAMATDLRRSNVQRIAAQQNPDGSPFAPRRRAKKAEPLRAKAGRVKRKAAQLRGRPAAMFRKLRRPSHLGIEANPDSASVGFNNAMTARIARVHQLGLVDRVSRHPGAPEVSYPVRALLGFTEEDRQRLVDAALAHLGG